MKLVIVTAVEQFHSEVLKLFKKADIENFSGSDMDGYKNRPSIIKASNWFVGEKVSNQSPLFFSFTKDEHIEELFQYIEKFNSNYEINNPLKAVMVPVEKFI